MWEPNGDEARTALSSLFGFFEDSDLPLKVFGRHAGRVEAQGFGSLHKGHIARHPTRFEVRDGLSLTRQGGCLLQAFWNSPLLRPRALANSGSLRAPKSTKNTTMMIRTSGPPMDAMLLKPRWVLVRFKPSC